MSGAPNSKSEIIWRFQSGPMRHLGASSSGVVAWQKSPITGTGQRSIIWLHLVADIVSGRVLAEIATPGREDPSTFLERALADAAVLGGRPTTIVFAREATRTNPRLIEITSDAGVTPAYGTNAFKLCQKISRHFEEFLHSRIVAHSSLARLDNLIACLPALVEAWNIAGQSSEDAISQRYFAAHQAVESRLGPDPQKEAEEEFRQRRLDVRAVRITQGSPPDFDITDPNGRVFDYLGFDLHFLVGAKPFQAPLFAYSSANTAVMLPRGLRAFNPDSILLRKADVPVELRDAWRMDNRQLDHAISVRDVLRAMDARGGALNDIAGALRQTIAAWITRSEPPKRHMPERRADTQPTTELQSAGVHFANESWERIRERHFWRVQALWDPGLGSPIAFARVQIESNGRLHVLPEHSVFTDGSGPLNEFLRSVFLREHDSVVTSARRREIVATLVAGARARASRHPL